MTVPRITIITFAWPPRNSIGAHRPYSWAKYWSDAGVRVRVLTARKYAYDAPLDLMMPVLRGVEVIEVDYATKSTSIASWILSTPMSNAARKMYRIMRGTSSAIRNPREHWLTAVQPRIQEFADDTDVIVSTYDPRMTHQIAAKMKEQNPRLIWVADYRDLWSLNHASCWTKEQQEIERRIECETVGKYADLVCSISDELSQRQGNYVEKPWLTVANGFDVDLKEVAKAIERQPGEVKRPLKIVYTGKIYQGFRDPSPLMEVIARMEETGEIERGDIVIDIFGAQVDGIDQIMHTGCYDHFVTLHGHVVRGQALEAQRNADLLLLLESPLPEASGVLTGKIFEYMATGNPILSLGSRRDSAIGSVLARTQTGICAENDEEVIRQVLRDRLCGRTLSWFAPDLGEIGSYSRKAQATKLLDEIRSLIKGRLLGAVIP